VRKVHLIGVAFAACPTLAACGGHGDMKAQSAPISAKLGTATFDIPVDPKFTRSTYQSRNGVGEFASFDLCSTDKDKETPVGCEIFASLDPDQRGAEVQLYAPKPWTHYNLLRERLAKLPSDGALIRLGELSPAAKMGASSPGENYQLSRIVLPFASTLMTTSASWPIAACGPHPSTKMISCSVGFVIKDAFVTARWQTGKKSMPSQRQVWDVASTVNRLLLERLS
jgi:hypothetical protein